MIHPPRSFYSLLSGWPNRSFIRSNHNVTLKFNCQEPAFKWCIRRELTHLFAKSRVKHKTCLSKNNAHYATTPPIDKSMMASYIINIAPVEFTEVNNHTTGRSRFSFLNVNQKQEQL